MALVKQTLQQNIYNGFYKLLISQSNKATDGDENENPEDVIRQMSNDMAKVIADAVDAYIKSGDITVGPANVQVTSSAPGTPAVVAPLTPCKMK